MIRGQRLLVKLEAKIKHGKVEEFSSLKSKKAMNERKVQKMVSINI